MTQTAIYARYSTDDQRSASIDDQVRNGQEIAERHGLPTPLIYNDEAISGTRLDRPDFQRLLNDLERGFIQVLIVVSAAPEARIFAAPCIAKNRPSGRSCCHRI
ncbi:MAG: recombinase family protein, partial [Sedimenticola sp.]